jgi:hypothetical protein
MATQIKLRRDTSGNWTSLNPVLALGEPGYETNTGKLKIGDGVSAWNTLSYFNTQAPDLTAFAGHIVPGSDNTYDLGSPTKQWRHLYVANGSLYIGDIKLSNESGRLVVQQVTDAGLVTEAPIPNAPGSVTTDRLINGENTFELDVNGIPLLNGAVVTNSYNNNRLTVGSNIVQTPVDITMGGLGPTHTWQFNPDGTFVLPSDGDIIKNGVSVLGGGAAANLGNFKIQNNILGTVNDPDTGGWGGFDIGIDPGGESNAGVYIPGLPSQSSGGHLQIYNNNASGGIVDINTYGGLNVSSARGTLAIGTELEGVGAPTHFHIAFEGSNLNASSSELFLGDDFNYVKMISSGQGVEIGTNDRNTSGQNNWQFNSYNNTLFTPPDAKINQNYSVTRTSQGGTSGGAGVVWTSSDGTAITSAKLTIQIEANEVGGDGQWHTQVCEATIAGRWNGGEPAMTVYAITHTSIDDLATFTVQRNLTSGCIEVVATPTVTNAQNGVQFRIHSVELYTRD